MLNQYSTIMIKNVLLFVLAVIVVSCGPSPEKIAEREAAEAAAKPQQFIQDSIARATFVRDSLMKIKIINNCKGLFVTKKDEFSDIAWVKPKSAPKYRNRNAIYAYFGMENNTPTVLRFVFQYHADDWLFIQSLIFNIDGENITLYPNMETDCGNGGKIWEWCDERVYPGLSASTDVNDYFIRKLGSAKSVKVKMNGRQYYNTRTLTSEQIKSIRDTYNYFWALGGSI